MKITYKIRSTTKPNVNLYLTFNGYKIRLPIVVETSKWNKGKQQVKGNDYLNAKLVKLNADILKQYNKAVLNREIIDLSWLKFTVTGLISGKATTPSNYFVGYLALYVKNTSYTGKSFAMLKANIGTTVLIQQITLDWLNNWCKMQLANGYSPNYIGKQVQLIRRVLTYANKNGVEIKHDIYDLKKPNRQTLDVYLNPAELQLIFDHDFCNDKLNNVKRLFLVGCTTGLRVSDLMQIENHVINDDYLLIKNVIKTKQSLTIPLDPRVKPYIKLLRPISAVKFNLYIKEMCEILGIDELTSGYVRGKGNKRVKGLYPKHKLISSHTMRRSFASNLYGKVPTVVIMAITGHTTEQSFLTYIKKPQREFALQLNQFYQDSFSI